MLRIQKPQTNGVVDICNLNIPICKAEIFMNKRWDDYVVTVTMPMSHPLYPYDDIRNNPVRN